MAQLEVSKLDIASEYLDAAIEFFLGNSNLFCAIHLAAAAEELFGAHLLEHQRISALARKAEKVFKSEAGPTASDSGTLKSINEWKNGIKHMNDLADSSVSLDPTFVAQHHIEHALINFYKLHLKKSTAIWKFEDNVGLAIS